jgi:predicted lipoprotein with Yx(FWY)xxD motif
MKTKSLLMLVAGLAAATTLSVATTASAAARPGRSSHATAAPKVLTGGVIVIKVSKFGSVLGDRTGHTLYLLNTEAGAKLHCKSAACLATWPPLEISKGQKVGIGTGVKGKVATVARSSTVLQVTFNGWPVYTYSGDSGKAQTHGEGLNEFGGLWYMLRPSATTSSGTPVV